MSRDAFELVLPTRAYVELEAPPKPRAVLLGFHGYAQAPSDLLADLDRPSLAAVAKVTPRGQHHFYNRRGEVVASWMTRFQREHQVEQGLAYARQVVAQCESRWGRLPLYIFGFSQGAAMAYRVAVLGGLEVSTLFCLAGDMPPEVASALASHPSVPVELLWGDTDTRVPLTKMEADRARLAAAGWPHQVTIEAGGHACLPALIDRVGQVISGR